MSSRRELAWDRCIAVPPVLPELIPLLLRESGAGVQCVHGIGPAVVRHEVRPALTGRQRQVLVGSKKTAIWICPYTGVRSHGRAVLSKASDAGSRRQPGESGQARYRALLSTLDGSRRVRQHNHSLRRARTRRNPEGLPPPGVSCVEEAVPWKPSIGCSHQMRTGFQRPRARHVVSRLRIFYAAPLRSRAFGDVPFTWPLLSFRRTPWVSL